MEITLQLKAERSACIYMNAQFFFFFSFRCAAEQDKSRHDGYSIGDRDEYGSRV